MIEAGTKVYVVVEATIKTAASGHGTCYFVELDQKDYVQPRTVWVNADEVLTRDGLRSTMVEQIMSSIS